MENFTQVEKLAACYSGLFVGTLSWALTEVQRLGFSFDSLEQIAQKRMELGPYHQISWTGTRTTASLIAYGSDYALTTDRLVSPLNASASAEIHAMGEEVPFVHSSIRTTVYVPSESFDIPAGELATSEIGKLLFGEAASAYGEWLQAASIKALPVDLPPISLAKHYPGPFIRPLIIRCTDNWSGIVADGTLHHPYGFRATAQTIGHEVTVAAEETFTPGRLELLADILQLEERSYSLSELEEKTNDLGYGNAFGVMLRLIRGESQLPVNYGTFMEEK